MNPTPTAPTDPTDPTPTDPAVSGPTPGQTVGPFFGYALPVDRGSELVAPGSPGSIHLHGVVTDGAGHPVPDALLEIWQATTAGTIAQLSGSLRRDGATFTGWGRAATDGEGHYGFTTVPPGPTHPGAAPFILVAVFARGLLDRLFTRAYLPGAHLDTDPLLTSLAPERRHTLITTADHTGLRFDITLQGPDETVFLHYPGHQP
jgi:protocatechuate 3,4-dioxygenase, alpha subunit